MANTYEMVRFFTPGGSAPSPEDVFAGVPVIDVFGTAQLSDLRVDGPEAMLSTSGRIPRLTLYEALGRITYGSVGRDGAFVPSGEGTFTAQVTGIYEGPHSVQPLIIKR